MSRRSSSRNERRSSSKPNEKNQPLAVQEEVKDEVENSFSPPQQQPIVFQCNGCLQIIGDSLSWVSGVPVEMSCISLSHVAIDAVDIGGDEMATTSTRHGGLDMGSFYIPIQCSNCSATIGRMYKTTPKILDHLRDNYTFDNACIKSYELGFTTKQQQQELDDDSAGGACKGKTVQLLTPQERDIIRPQYNQIAQRFALMETVIMQLHEQIETINARLHHSK